MGILLLIALLTLSLPAGAFSSPIALQFYKVRVSLSNGRVIEGYSYGVSWIGGTLTQERRVRSVLLRAENGTVTAAFEFPGDDTPLVCEARAKDEEGKSMTLAVASEYELFHRGVDFHWMKGVQEYPLHEVLRIDTVDFIGPGLRVLDPRDYLDLREPFILVEDCRIGCEMKMHSKDPLVTKEMLQILWNNHFMCGERSVMNQKERDGVRETYQLEWLSDPFCHD
jgi:hypothetical protein